MSIEEKKTHRFSDLLEGILRVLLQFAEEGNFELVSDKKQLATQN